MQVDLELYHALGGAWARSTEALDRISFAPMAEPEGFSSAPLLWLLDYACRDDFGAAGSRLSRRASDTSPAATAEWPAQAESRPVLTWPQAMAG